jgi:hypothetical protein
VPLPRLKDPDDLQYVLWGSVIAVSVAATLGWWRMGRFEFTVLWLAAGVASMTLKLWGWRGDRLQKAARASAFASAGKNGLPSQEPEAPVTRPLPASSPCFAPCRSRRFWDTRSARSS